MVNHADIAPPFAGLLFGVTNTIASIPGVIAPYVVGLLTQNVSTIKNNNNNFFRKMTTMICSLVNITPIKQGNILIIK